MPDEMCGELASGAPAELLERVAKESASIQASGLTEALEKTLAQIDQLQEQQMTESWSIFTKPPVHIVVPNFLSKEFFQKFFIPNE